MHMLRLLHCMLIFSVAGARSTTRGWKCVCPFYTNITKESFYSPIQLPSDPCWPPSQEWAFLNETISGRLIRTVPLASVCYKSEPNYNQESCNRVLANWTSSAFHAADPASVGNLTWTNSSCLRIYPNGTSIGGDPDADRQGCSLGNFSPKSSMSPRRVMYWRP